MTLRFAIHGHCLIRKVKYRHQLGEVDLVVLAVSHSSRYSLQEITTIYLTLSKLCPKYCTTIVDFFSLSPFFPGLDYFFCFARILKKLEQEQGNRIR